MRYFALCMLFCFSLFLQAQETETFLMFDATKAKRAQMEKSWDQRSPRGNGSISLPFFDDFATYSLPTNDPNIPVELQRWSDESAHINCSFPILPPTVGVATLDGLDLTGYPYNFSTPDAFGTADTLTSIPIDLSGLTANDNVYLTFFYQGGGRGNAPDTQDSLFVEFYAPAGGDNPWFKVWIVPGSEMTEFEQVFIPIDNAIYLQDGFQFRFRNYSTLTGNLDHWHIDYVYVDDNINPDAFNFFEVAFVDCEYTLLNEFTAMPWTHFLTNPEVFMADTSRTIQRNLSSTQADNVTSGFKVEYDGQIWNNLNDFSQIVVFPESTFTTDYAINNAPNNFVYDASVNDTCAVFNVSYYQDNIGILQDEKIGVADNDSIVFQQVFTNYYAYDDGSAERAYALNTTGGKVAVRYPIQKADTLLGLFIHFTPFQDDNSGESFLLRAWSISNGLPGSELMENYTFHSPEYYTNGYDVFGYYEYDAPIPVSVGSIFVGFVQNSEAELNVGLDKNTNSNATRLFYQLGNNAQWIQSSIQGSLMIRPVFKSGKTSVWNGVEEMAEASTTAFPNPATTVVNLQFSDFSARHEVRIFNTTGALVGAEWVAGSTAQIGVGDLPEGLYIIGVFNEFGVLTDRLRIVKAN